MKFDRYRLVVYLISLKNKKMYFLTIISLFFITFINHTFPQEPDSYGVHDHSLSRPYTNIFSTSRSYWHLTGNTLATDRFIRLTADTQSRTGGLWDTIPVSYPDWELQVHFKVHGEGGNFFGDGLAIWYVRDPKLTGPVFGYADHFCGLAIILDTYANTNDDYTNTYPFISAVINNGSLHYDNDRDGRDITVAGCEAAFRGRDLDTRIAIRYQDNRLIVYTDIEGVNAWAVCFIVDNVHLPTHYYFGFTAATGELSDNHDIISVYTYQLNSNEDREKEDRKNIIPSAPSSTMGNTTNHTPKSSKSSALKIFFIVSLLVIICLIGIGAFYYMKQRRYHSSRLY
ncbi:unnamed protein product [Rotaria sordida]|uniref:L-type lectin-like domain-containing protein n=1 Tax=Rotaria sordida TaxID=392033 RepID=A0A815T5Y2_9BILA|nr:unnamed protein product [Rotaria sordida]CAF1496867.1 unnamed protein product [Rotaria sordida]